MRVLDKELENRKINLDKLIAYGFSKKDDYYIYETELLNDNFKMIVEIVNNKTTAKVIDINTNEDYVLVDVADSTGKFVGALRSEYESKLKDIINICTEMDVFKSKQAKQIIKYIKDTYGDELEFLWKNPKNAVFRKRDTKKWYGALLVISKAKLGFDDDTVVEIIDLRNTPEEIEKLVDGKKFFDGYHMNKKHWLTIILDGSVPIEEIYQYIDISYNVK